MPEFIRRMRQRPPLRTTEEESYFEKLLKNIPADIVAGWTALQGIIVDQAGNSPTIQWIVFGVLLVLTPLYVCYIKTEPKGFTLNKIFFCFSSLLSFTVWVFALGGPFLAQWPKWYQPYLGSIALILTTLILPVLERAFYESNPPAQPPVLPPPTQQPPVQTPTLPAPAETPPTQTTVEAPRQPPAQTPPQN